jgi:AraC-like DNA-binding protein
MAFLLRPGVWHRFRPDHSTGWTESWIEFQGSVPDALSSAGQMGETMIVRSGASSTGLPEAINAVFQRISHALPGLDPQMTAFAMDAVAAWSLLWTPRAKDDEVDRALSIATHFLEREYRTSINLEKLARRVGMSYSSFRRSFQKRTGFAPWKYVQHLRLVNARNRLGSSSDTLEEIATNLGFSSGFHLSTAFRKEFGVSPLKWKKENAMKGSQRPDSKDMPFRIIGK